MRELFDRLLPVYLENGGGVFDFYDLSYGEIMIVIDANKSRVKHEAQISASMFYTLARLTSYSFADPSKMPSIQESFPSLFEATESVEAQPVQDWRLMKDILMGYSEQHNEKMKRKEE